MKKLSKDWFVEGLIDFEYKKYILLDYLKQVHSNFNRNALYPSFSDVIYHYRNILEYVTNKNNMATNFPKELENVNIKKLKLEYKRMVDNDELMEELQNISDYAINQFKATLSTGKEIYEFAESHFTIEPIGIRPMYIDEGYLFAILPPGNSANIYFYKVQLFENNSDSYRSLMLRFVETKPIGLVNTLENIKVELAKKFEELPNPATYCITSSMKFPYKSTFLPIAKRLLMKSVAA